MSLPTPKSRFNLEREFKTPKTILLQSIVQTLQNSQFQQAEV
jgi:hypothetical protein